MIRPVTTRATSSETPKASYRFARVWLMTAFLFGALAPQCYAFPAHHLGQQNSRPAPNHSNPLPAQPRPNNSQARPHPDQPHLSQWMQTHSNLTLEQQQKALEAEPGFAQLKPEIQQRMRDRLAELNRMSPDQRQQVIARTESMEHLTPDQRLQVRSALASLGSLPEDRRRAVARAFRTLRALPEEQRQAYLSGPAIRGQFSDSERTVLSNLFAAEPYMPPPAQASVPSAPQPPR